jgi:hypothetical protein
VMTGERSVILSEGFCNHNPVSTVEKHWIPKQTFPGK